MYNLLQNVIFGHVWSHSGYTYCAYIVLATDFVRSTQLQPNFKRMEDPKSLQPFLIPTNAGGIDIVKKNRKGDEDNGDKFEGVGPQNELNKKNNDEDLEMGAIQSSLKTNNTTNGWRRYLGIAYTILSVNMLSLTTTIMKKYSHIHPFNVGVWSSPASIFMTTTAIIYTKYWEKKSVGDGLFPLRNHKRDLFFLWLRAVLSSVISYLTIKAFQYVTAADVRTVIAASVIAVYIFGWIFLNEKCGVVPIFVAIIALVGIGVMTRPPALTGADEFDINTLIGIGLSFICMVVIAMNLVIIRYLNKIHHGITNLFVYMWGLTQGFILAFTFNVFTVPTLEEIVGLTVGGICLALALAFLVLGLQREEAGVVALVRTSEVIFVFFWQWVIVGTYPDLISVLGATIVVSGVVAVTLRKWVDSLPSDNPRRRQLAFLLL